MSSKTDPSDHNGYTGLEKEKLPVHVAIIMDGNGRWATQRYQNRIKGHEKGSEAVRTIVRACRKIGIPYLTLYAFSTENWQRPQAEVTALMKLLKRFLESEKAEMLENDIRLNAIGQIDRLPDDVSHKLAEVMTATKYNKTMTLNLALSYGGRTEILEMVRTLIEKVNQGKLKLDQITEDLIPNYLYTANIPDPDILIRTSGEMRISNFLLWQIAYAEIFITETLWPDFDEQEFIHILKLYQTRDRRFGKIYER